MFDHYARSSKKYEERYEDHRIDSVFKIPAPAGIYFG